MPTIYLCNSKAFEPFGPRSPNHPGIGGSETMQCEIAWRLASRGHTVVSYCTLDETQPSPYMGVEWRDISAFDATQPGLYILIRSIELLDQFEYDEAQRIWCVFQDVDTLTPWKIAWLPRVDRVIGLCRTHCDYLRRAHPEFAAKVYQSRNGIRGDLVDEILSVPPPTRDPHRLMWASSPDRGLLGLLQAFKLIRFLIPDAELHIFYGFDNLSKLEHRSGIKWANDRIKQAAAQPGVILHGRLGQPALYHEWLKTALLCAPTNFTETGYITLMEAQALGAIPIVNPVWAAAEYQLAGIAIEGDGERDALTLRRYAMAAAHLMRHPEGQEALRPAMMAAARKQFDWSGVVEQYEAWMDEDGKF